MLRRWIAVFALLVVPVSAFAFAETHFTWGACDQYAHDLPWTGQTSVKQVVSMSGLSGNPGDFTLVISLGRFGTPDPAWPCAFGLNVPNPPLASVAPATSGPCPTVPGLSVAGFAGGPCPTPDGCLTTILVSGTFPPGTNLDPAQTYALVELTADLSGITPANCPGGSLASAQCFGVILNSLASSPYHAQPEWLLSWNRPDGNADACAGVVPVRASSWGAIKTRYR